MVPEFASNVAHCDHIPVSLIRLRPRVKLGTRNRLCSWLALRFFESPMKEDADRDFLWACSNCTFQNAAGMWQCEMCSHHKPGESYYCVLVLSKHAAACFVGDSHSLLFFVVDALAGAMVVRMTDSGPAAVQATSTAPLLPMVAGDAGAGAGKRSREDPPSPQHKKLRTRRTARQKGSSTGLEVRVSCLVALLHFACALSVLFAVTAHVHKRLKGRFEFLTSAHDVSYLYCIYVRILLVTKTILLTILCAF